MFRKNKLGTGMENLETRAMMAADLPMALDAGAANDNLDVPAQVIHPNILANNGPGQNANPNGANNGGGNLHGIGNVPGKNADNSPQNGDPGFADQLETVHGGIGAYNPNA